MSDDVYSHCLQSLLCSWGGAISHRSNQGKVGWSLKEVPKQLLPSRPEGQRSWPSPRLRPWGGVRCSRGKVREVAARAVWLPKRTEAANSQKPHARKQVSACWSHESSSLLRCATYTSLSDSENHVSSLSLIFLICKWRIKIFVHPFLKKGIEAPWS